MPGFHALQCLPMSPIHSLCLGLHIRWPSKRLLFPSAWIWVSHLYSSLPSSPNIDGLIIEVPPIPFLRAFICTFEMWIFSTDLLPVLPPKNYLGAHPLGCHHQGRWHSISPALWEGRSPPCMNAFFHQDQMSKFTFHVGKINFSCSADVLGGTYHQVSKHFTHLCIFSVSFHLIISFLQTQIFLCLFIAVSLMPQTEPLHSWQLRNIFELMNKKGNAGRWIDSFLGNHYQQ